VGRIESSVVINRHIEEVFTYAADYRKDPSWRGEVRELRYLSDGPVGVGMRQLETSRLFGRTVVTESRISVHEPGRDDFEYVSGPYRVRGSRWFEAVDGGTRFTFVLEAQPERLLDSLLDPVLGFLYQKMADRYVHRLKVILEASPGQAG